MSGSGYVTARVAEVFVVYETIDDRGQRGRLVGAYAREGEATKAADGRGYYGGPGDIERRKALVTGAGEVWLLDARDPVTALDWTVVR